MDEEQVRQPSGNESSSLAATAPTSRDTQSTGSLNASPESPARPFFHYHPFPSIVYRRVGDDFILDDYNDAMQQQSGGRMAEFVGLPVRELYAPHPELIDKFHRCFESHQPERYSAPYRMLSTGEDKYLMISLAHVPPDYVLLVAEDVTEHMNAERDRAQAILDLSAASEELKVTNEELNVANMELANSREVIQQERLRYQELFDYAPDGYFLTDNYGIIREVNRTASTMLRVPRERLVGKPLVVFLVPSSRDEFRSRLNELTHGWSDPASGRDWISWIQPRESPPFAASIRVSSIRGASGQLTGFRWLLRDVSERMRIEQEIRDLNTQLDRRVGERTVELEIANRELESFSYSVSHDLRTPLATIESLAQMLQEDIGNRLPDAALHLSLIRQGAQQMKDLITSLLALSRLSRHPLKKQQVKMADLVQEVLASLGDLKRADLTVDVQDLPDAQADPVLLKQVWVNLISNACKFTRKCGNPRVEIGCGPADGEERAYRVHDNGVGFDMDQADRLFGVFQRLHPEEEYEGNGVGLAIVKRVITRHGGRVWAEAEENQGATFYFTLGQ